MANPFDEIVAVEETPVINKTEKNPFDDVVSNPFDEIVQEPDYPTLPEYLKFKIGMDTASAAKSQWGSKAMWGYATNEEAITKGTEEYNRHASMAGNFRDLSFKEAPFKYVVGETAQLIPYMLSSMQEGLKEGLILGGGFAAITAAAGQAGPQIALPEEVITVPVAFSAGMSTGYAFGVFKNTLNREGGGMYIDLIAKGIEPKTARPVAIASGSLTGVLEIVQFKLLSAPFKQAFSRVLNTDVAKKAITAAVGRYIKTVGGEVTTEEMQEVVSLIGETVAGTIDKNPNATPTKEEWKQRLVETAQRSLAGMAVISAPGAAVDVASSTKKDNSTAKAEGIVNQSLTDNESKIYESAKTKMELGNPLELEEQKVMEKIQKIKETVKVESKPASKVKVTPEKVTPDISGIRPLQKEIQEMGERQERVTVATDALDEIDTVREYFKKRITKYKDEYLKEELGGLPSFYTTKEKGIKLDEVIEELKSNFGIEISDETALVEYLKDIEQTKKDLELQIKTDKPQFVTKKETTILEEKIKATERGIKEGRMQTKEEISNVQNQLIDEIESARLPLEERAKFLKTIKNIQTKEDLVRALPEVIDRLRKAKEGQVKKDIIGEIKKIGERAKTSPSLAVEYADLIKSIINEFELKGHRKETIEAIKATKEFIERTDEKPSKEMLKKLDILERKPIKDVSKEDLESLLDTLENLEQVGRTKLRLRELSVERRKAQDLARLIKESKPIESKKELKSGIGEKLSVTEKLKNMFADKFNFLTEKKIVLTPMDVVIDELDGNKNYKGANFTIFKKPLDKAFSEYIVLRNAYAENVKKIAEGMDESNFKKIAVYATSQQENGIDKLESIGYTKEKIDKIILTDKEQALLDAMRKEFDKSWPVISEVMRTVYNAPMGKTAHYFPFMTDFDAMTDFEIREKFINNAEYSNVLKKNPELGFTKSRVGGEQKINLNAMEVFLRHMDDVAYLVTVGKEIKYLNDLAATKEYGEATGDIGQEIMREWLDLVARKGRLAGDRVPLFDFLRKTTSGAYLAFKASSALVQFTSIFDGAAMIGNYAFEGMQMITHKETRQFLKDNFPEWKERVVDDPAFQDFYKNNSLVDKAIKVGISPLRFFDKLMAASVNIGAYKKYCIENGIEFDMAKPNKEAIQYAQLMMRRTQASGLFKDIPLAMSKGILTGNISVDKILLQFQSFLLNRWSLISHDLYNAGIKGENKTQAVNIAFWLTMATMAEAIIRRGTREAIQSMKGDRKEKDEKTLIEEIFVGGLQNIPFMSNGISFMYYGSTGIPSFDWYKRISEYVSAGNKAKKEETRAKNYLKAILSAFPGGAQWVQMMPKK